MKKYLVDVYLPAASMHVDVFVPSNKQIGEIIRLLVTAVQPLSCSSYLGTADAMLLRRYRRKGKARHRTAAAPEGLRGTFQRDSGPGGHECAAQAGHQPDLRAHLPVPGTVSSLKFSRF